MRRCPKCAKVQDDASQYCSMCGAGLETVPAPAEPAPPDDEIVTAELIEADVRPRQPVGRGSWKCPQCHELVPRTFEVCWKCGTIGQSVAVGDRTRLPPEEPAEEVQEEELEPLDEPLARSARAVNQLKCAKCGSTRVIPDTPVLDEGQNSDGKLQVVVYGDPQAMFLKDRLYGAIVADVCGDCGHVDFRVDNADDLYQHYLRSLE